MRSGISLAEHIRSVLFHPRRMLQNLFALVNVIGLFLVEALITADIRITQQLPGSIQPGTEVRVTVTIDKGGLTGFAKLQLDLPPGLSATAIDTKGASFTFDEQKAKFIWMSVPSQPSFNITYSLVASPNATGVQPIIGRFSYIEENERRTYDLQPINVDMGAVADNQGQTGYQDLASDGGFSISQPGAARIVHLGDIAPEAGLGGVSATRVITQLSETEFSVEVTVQKDVVRGFGKLQERVPTGFTAMEVASEEAIFTAQDKVVKFVWLNLPAKNEMKISYRLRANDQPEGDYQVNGDFGYLLNDETQKAVLGTTHLFVGNKQLATKQAAAPTPSAMAALPVAGTTTTAPPPTTSSTPPANSFAFTPNQPQETVLAQMPQQDLGLRIPEPKMSAPAQALPKTTVEPPRTEVAMNGSTAQDVQDHSSLPVMVSSQPEPTVAVSAPSPLAGPSAILPVSKFAPEVGVSYKVQITAAHRTVGKEYFAKRHKYEGDFVIEQHEGWVKYVTGRFPEYAQARNVREDYVSAGHKFPGPFVTAYSDGQRITVQEALMLSNQQWMQ
jgi:hypothetical protein